MASEINPSLESLALLAGQWDMELSNAAFLPSPSATVHFQISIDWIEEGAFLLIRMGDRRADQAWALWLIGRDETRPGYQVLYYDTRKASRIYEMSFAGGIWKMWREAAGLSQRFEGQVSPGGNSIRADWEKSTDGKTWEHDFSVTYRRVI